MMNRMDVFCEIPCLTEQSKLFGGISLQKKWFKSADKRIIGQYLQKFIAYNTANFNFLGIHASVEGTDQNSALRFRTTEFIGVIPLRAPDTGKQIGDFIVSPRFSTNTRFEDYVEILNLLENEISPQVIDSLPLVSGNNFKPPLYLEAVKFVSALEALLKTHWRKFDVVERYTSQPIGQINWNKYAEQSYKVENRTKFPSRKNILSEFHSEYAQIRYVFGICYRELMSANTPQRIKNTLRNRLHFIEEKLYFHFPKPTKKIKINSFDNPKVKTSKQLANKILAYNFVESTAWRVDFSDVFEKFVQHIFKEVAKEIGGKLLSNYKFRANSSSYFSWELKHVEPDAIFQKEDILIFVDAKYKANLYNKFSPSEKLKEEHRRDLHQVMAYSSFSDTTVKYGALCYPSQRLEFKETVFKNGINSTENRIFLFGIPLKKDSIVSAKELLATTIDKIETKIMYDSQS